MTTDPAVRYTAGGILLAAFLGGLAVVVHGYWLNANYMIPSMINSLLTITIGAAATLLGVHIGQFNTQHSVQQGADVTRAAQTNGTTH